MAAMISPFNTLVEIDELLTACKQAIKDVMLGKRSSFNGREWSGEDLDKLQNMLQWLGSERVKFQTGSSGNSARPVSVIGRPAR